MVYEFAELIFEVILSLLIRTHLKIWVNSFNFKNVDCRVSCISEFNFEVISLHKGSAEGRNLKIWANSFNFKDVDYRVSCTSEFSFEVLSSNSYLLRSTEDDNQIDVYIHRQCLSIFLVIASCLRTI